MLCLFLPVLGGGDAGRRGMGGRGRPQQVSADDLWASSRAHRGRGVGYGH